MDERLRGFALLVLAGGVLWGGSHLWEQHQQARKDSKLCNTFLKSKVIKVDEVETCEDDAEFRSQSQRKQDFVYAVLLRDDAAPGTKSLSDKYLAIVQATASIDPKLSLTDKDVKLPESFRLDLRRVSIDRPDPETTNRWSLSGDDLSTGHLVSVSLTGMPPIELEGLDLACSYLAAFARDRGCKASVVVNPKTTELMPWPDLVGVAMVVELPSDDDLVTAFKDK